VQPCARTGSHVYTTRCVKWNRAIVAIDTFDVRYMRPSLPASTRSSVASGRSVDTVFAGPISASANAAECRVHDVSIRFGGSRRRSLKSAPNHTPAPFRAASTRSSRNGTLRMRTPVASWIAFPMAASIGLSEASPAP